MKIKKLDICGFKSFVDRTVVRFDHDVTGVVGPNGCGKSNIVDAIRWCMGEQSAKHLRGRAMEDVIFNGCETRGPSGFAEVTLTFDNADGLAPAEYRDYGEIAVTRRLDRLGNSEYLINRTPVRLMDVTSLFLGTGVGTKAYSIIEQGRIGLIVSAKPEDRRHLIEEAAGITKFKARKKAAERKMDQTRQNLLRVHDIIGEIERSLASLKRQAQKAERYKQYRAEMRDLELHVVTHRWLELTAVQKVVRADLERSAAGHDGARIALRVREAELEAERLALHDVESALEARQKRSYELDNAVSTLEGLAARHLAELAGLRDRERAAEREIAELDAQRVVLRGESAELRTLLEDLEREERGATAVLEREQAELEQRRAAATEATASVDGARARLAEAETRIARAEAVLQGFDRRRAEARSREARLRAERERLEAQAIDVAQQREELLARLEGLRTDKQQTALRRADIEVELAALLEEIRESDRRLEQVRAEATERRSRLRSLEEIRQRFEGVGAGVRALMTHFGADDRDRERTGVLGLVADRLDCPHELTKALAGVLGAELQSVVVRDLEVGVEGARFLTDGKHGRATMVLRSPTRVVAPMGKPPAEPGVVGYLADLVRCEPADEPLVRHLLGDVLVVEDLEAAVRLHESGIDVRAVVTRNGEVVERDGRLVGGWGDDASAHMLDVKREMRELERMVVTLDAELGAAVTRHGELRKRIAQRQAELESARTEAHDAEIAIVTTEKDARRAEEGLVRTRERLEAVGIEIDELVTVLAQADDEEALAREEIGSATAVRAASEGALVTAETLLAERTASLDAQSTIVTEVRVRAAQAKQKVEGDRAALERLDRSITELDARETRLRGDIADGARQEGRLAAEVMRTRESLGERVVEASAARDALGEARARYDEARVELGRQETSLREIRARLETLGQRVSDLMMSERDLVKDLEHLLEHVRERHRLELGSVVGAYHLRELPDESVRSRIDELGRLIERMGEINLTAIDEYDEQSKRYEFFTTQRADLESALEQLDRAIRKMNRESRRMFRETFDAVNERFQRTFPKMFGGGKAELRLTNPEDLLESGVDIVAQPPGKRLGSIELMSGGEKALTAVSLIFAIFQHKPSPFCLLDEVDAPLDEANIDRFADAIRQMTGHSQFIVITHSKRTMETTDVLYGVTMETAGISKLVSVELRRADARRTESEAPQGMDEHVAVA